MGNPSPDECDHDYQVRCRRCGHLEPPLPDSDLEVIVARLNRHIVEQNGYISRLEAVNGPLARPAAPDVVAALFGALHQAKRR